MPPDAAAARYGRQGPDVQAKNASRAARGMMNEGYRQLKRSCAVNHPMAHFFTGLFRKPMFIGLTLFAVSACDQRISEISHFVTSDREIASKALLATNSQGLKASRFSSDNVAEALISYANAQNGVDQTPEDIDANWGMKAQPYDARASLQQALASRQLEAWVDGLPPQQPAYETLRQAFLRYHDIAKAGGWPQIPAGPALSIGSKDARVAILRQRLARESGDASDQPAAPFDQALAQSLGAAQARYGLPVTGKLDEPTRAALNVSVQTRLQQMQANLQRWRWAPRAKQPDRIEVNIAAGLANVFLGDQLAMNMRVAIGRPADQTPMLVSTVHTVVLNPTWSVPDSIAQNELMPKEAGENGYLARSGFILDQSDGKPRLVQAPGPKNALGLVKFQFDNKYSVYLHDTPAKAAFAQSQRSVSHGCVRLERAVDLAKLLLAREAGWNAGRVDSVIASGKTTGVKLTTPLQVGLYYWTAWVENGQVQFRRDIYGWDYPTAQLANGVVVKPKPAMSSTSPTAAKDGGPDIASLEDLLPSELPQGATYADFYTQDPLAAPSEDSPEEKGL